MTLVLRYAARSDVGLVRSNNEDSVYAGARLLALADGMGGHAAGEVASQLVIAALAHLDDDEPGGDLLAKLDSAVQSGNSAIAAQVEMEPELDGMGTTLTAILFAGNRIGLVHIGDSRGYLLRDGELTQITKDDTFVQTLVDEGRITNEEAHSHPQRSLIMRALTGHEVEPTLIMREVRLGDRYLLCSDGLSDPVSHETILDALQIPDVTESADRLIELALRGGGPDNVTVVVADVVDYDYGPTQPILAGAVSGDSDVHDQRPGPTPRRAAPRRSRRAKRSPNALCPDRDTPAAEAVTAPDLDRRRPRRPARARRAGRRPDRRPQQLLRHRHRRHGVHHARDPRVNPGCASAPTLSPACLNSRNELSLMRRAGRPTRLPTAEDRRLGRVRTRAGRRRACLRARRRRDRPAAATGHQSLLPLCPLARAQSPPAATPPPAAPPPTPTFGPPPDAAPGTSIPEAPQASPLPDTRRADRHRALPAAAPAGHQLPDCGMTTQPQAPVTVTPSLPNRRNAELLLLGFAAVITTARC